MSEEQPTEDPTKVVMQLTVKLKNGGEQKVKVEAELFGSLAVHHGIMDVEGMWCVTHRTSSLRFATMESGDDARKFAETLNNWCTRAMTMSDEESILDAMPMKAIEWLKQCVKAKKFVTPAR